MKNEKALVKKPVDKLKAIINSPTVQEQFQNALGEHKDLFVASLIDIFNSGLHDCEPGTVIQEALKAAVLKLPISKSLGFAYLVPYNQKYKDGNQWKSKKVPQFQIGYKGMIQLAMRSGQVRILNAGAVYDGEFKSFDKLTGMVDLTGEMKSNQVVGYFCYMELINGFKKSEYWTKERIIEHAKNKSKSYQADLKYNNKKSAWVTDFDPMATKTVLISMLSKYAPMSVEFIFSMQSEKTEEPESKNIDFEAEDLGPVKKEEEPQEQAETSSQTAANTQANADFPEEPPFGA